MCNVTIITGTGRVGTSFLIGFMSLLGLPTGYNRSTVEKVIFGTAAHAGLEYDPPLRGNLLPCSKHHSIFKSPRLFANTYWLNAANIGFVFLPVRKSEDAAASREYQSLYHNKRVGGWSYNTHNVTEQMTKNDHDTANFLWKFSRVTRPRLVLLEFPQHVIDSKYAYSKLREFVSQFGVSEARFHEVHAELSRKDFVHNFSAHDAVRARLKMRGLARRA